MKRLHHILLLLLFCPLIAYSQITTPGIPESFALKNKAVTPIPVKNLGYVDTSYLLKEEKEQSIPNRYGIIQHFRTDLKKDGIPTIIEGKGTIWQYKVISQQANSIGIRFSSFYIPDGARVYIYNEEHTNIMGAFTSLDNLTNKILPIADFKGNSAIIEYFEPFDAEFQGELVIGSVALAYKKLNLNGIDRIGINCPEGADWQDAKHSVCLMTYNDSTFLYYCTGFLVNNVREDGTPYFQTANHCLNNNYMASTLVTYFNFEQSACSVDSILYSPSLAGASIIASSSYSDFSLLKLSQYPPDNYLPYYAGWNANIEYAKTGTCIHHPSRLPKCISYDTLSPRNYPFSINWQDTSATPISEPGTHWEVLFSRGSVEPGSSGSPLFNEKKQVIGQLHGGSSSDGFFGKFSLSWNYYNGISKQLKYWLDPDSSGVFNLEGSFIPRKPKASFSTKFTDACNGAKINFKNYSKYAPKKWLWQVFPAEYNFVNGTDSSSVNPEIIFTKTGKYTISLIVSNEFGTDTSTMSDYINSVYIHTHLSGLPSDQLVCGCNLNNFPITASDATSYTFKCERTDRIIMIEKADSLYLTLKPGMKKYGSFDSRINVTGMNRSCVSSDSLVMRINMPVNDDLENAAELFPGNNGSYTNFCASAEKNEPYPADNSCLSLNSWCPENPSTTAVLNNTTWFWFRAPASGEITINTHGINNRMALYETDSPQKLLSGDALSYTIVAANDNRSATDSTAYLPNIKVKPHKIYWLQVDGDKHETGNFTIELQGNSIEVSPNPSSGIFKISFFSFNEGIADIRILSSLGLVVYSGQIVVTPDSNQFEFDLSAFTGGIYYLITRINGFSSRAKLLLLR